MAVGVDDHVGLRLDVDVDASDAIVVDLEDERLVGAHSGHGLREFGEREAVDVRHALHVHRVARQRRHQRREEVDVRIAPAVLVVVGPDAHDVVAQALAQAVPVMARQRLEVALDDRHHPY